MMSRHRTPTGSHAMQIRMEASRWLLRLQDVQPATQDPCDTVEVRNAAFHEWLAHSPEHLKVFLEIYEIDQRLGRADLRGLNLSSLLEPKNAAVIPLFKQTNLSRRGQQRHRRLIAGISATVAFLLMGGLSWRMLSAPEYSTAVGEQHTCKLDDGSFVYLNTDSQIRVNFSKTQRQIELLRGEALFIVEHDSARPFTVTTPGAADAVIRALGTQFNVRRHADQTDVTVVEGVVQVSEAANKSVDTSAAPSRTESLSAGEQARVTEHQIRKETGANVSDALSWRQRRLIFRKTPLAEVAAEFNQYNRTKIMLDPDAGQDIHLTGVFDADRPAALILYAQKLDNLDVQREGDHWRIKSAAR